MAVANVPLSEDRAAQSYTVRIGVPDGVDGPPGPPVANGADVQTWLTRTPTRQPLAVQASPGRGAAAHGPGESRGFAFAVGEGAAEEMRTKLEERRRALLALEERAEELRDAVTAWRRVEERRVESEAALVALWERVSVGGTMVAVGDVVADMGEAETMIGRADRRCSSAVASAHKRVAEAWSAAQDATDAVRNAVAGAAGDPSGRTPLPMPILGLQRFRQALGDSSLPAPPGADGAIADPDRSTAGTEGASQPELGRGGAPAPAPDDAAMVVAGLRTLVAGSLGGAVVVDDLFVDLDDALLTRVLRHVPSAVGSCGLIYLTQDPRVLAWALNLPPEIGRVSGARNAAIQPAIDDLNPAAVHSR